MHPYKNAYKKKGLIFKSRPPFDEMPNRSIITNVIDYETCLNQIKTSKYTPFNFIPLNLYHQFSKVANLYFLMVGIMQMIPEISISGGMPVIFLPLSLVVMVSAIKDIFEDLKRKKSDQELNGMQTQLLQGNQWKRVRWEQLRLGQIVKVEQNQMIPADMILLQTSQEKRNCYIETKNLDGQTNLKHRVVQFDVGTAFQRSGDMSGIRLEFFYQRPNPYIHTFSGKCALTGDRNVMLDNNNVVLRGCCLRITKFIIGVVIYTGYDSKIMLNSNKTRQKKSRLQFKMGIIVAVIFLTQMALTFLSALLSAHWSSSFLDLYDYLHSDVNFLYRNEIFTKWGSWILLFTNFVPISLIVSLQMVKFIQGIYISRFKFDTEKPSQIVVQSSNLNEQLGQIHHFFSDKTGTLTCNYMSFKYFVVNGKTYGQGDKLSKQQLQLLPKVTNVQFNDRDFMMSLRRNQMDSRVFDFMLCLTLCHSVIIEQAEDGVKYNASSPDELAFINFGRFCGLQYLGLNRQNQHVLQYNDRTMLFKQLHVIEFNSDRKRMSVLVEYEGRIILMCKGADNMILKRLIGMTPDVEYCNQRLEDFSVQGLRTLMFAKKQISQEFYQKWSKLYVNALTKLETVEKQEKERLKQETEMMQLHKKKSSNEGVNIKDMLNVESNVKKLGSAIIEAEEPQKQALIKAQIDQINARLRDNLILTENQRKFLKTHNRETRLESNMSAPQLQQAIEKDLYFVGATAIQDKLQDRVKQTIEALRQAGIKVWMLTGDKRQTAINIGYSCGLIDEDMAKLVFDESVQKTMQNLQQYKGRDVCLVITGQQLLANKDADPKELLNLVLQCRSIIACRVSPKQKQEMVALLRHNRYTTCAIGDGANDVNMINMAHVGIGIKGVEGAQAAQCSDYAISQFQMVKELLLYHGRESYRKNSRLILFNFYKNMILVLPQFWFGMTNGFSSASMFDPWIYQLYNVVYTSLPIIIYAIFDEEYTPRESTSRPELYKPGLTNQNFNLTECMKWFVSPALQAGLLCFLTLQMFEATVSPSGQTMFFATTGMVIFAQAVFICNIKVLIIAHQHSVGSFLSVVGSVLLFYVTYFWAQRIFKQSSIYNTLQHQLDWSVYYLTLGAVVSLVCLIEVALTRWSRTEDNKNQDKKDIQLPLLK